MKKGPDSLSETGHRTPNTVLEKMKRLFGIGDTQEKAALEEQAPQREGQNQEPEKLIISNNPLIRIRQLDKSAEEYRTLEAQIKGMNLNDFHRLLQEAGYSFPNDSRRGSNVKVIGRFQTYINQEEIPVIKEKLEQLLEHLRNPFA